MEVKLELENVALPQPLGFFRRLQQSLRLLWRLPELLQFVAGQEVTIQNQTAIIVELERTVGHFVELATAFSKSADENLGLQTLMLKASEDLAQDGLTDEELNDELDEVNSLLVGLQTVPIVGRRAMQKFFQEESLLKERQTALLGQKAKRVRGTN